MYLSKESILKAYELLSKATPSILNNFSAIQYFVATDRFYKNNNTPCDSSDSSNKSKFYEYVEDIVSLDDSHYLSTFKVVYEGNKSVSSTVSSNFFSGSSVEHSNNTPKRRFDYPKKGPLLYAMDGKVYKEESYYSNLSEYLPTKEEKFALAVWLLRRDDSFRELSLNEFRLALSQEYSSLLVNLLIPQTEQDIDLSYLSCNNAIAVIAKSDIKGSKSNQHFTKSMLNYQRYLTAIKSKPFLLLAGISGTGKSRIVRELARACWDADSEEYKAQKPKNFEMVQVKPNWHDSSELIGYVSRIGIDKDGNPRPTFVAGDFLRFVAKAWEEPDVPYFLCLDEMNLAPVEQYFAEYLSVVESRKADDEGHVTTDPILKSNEQWFFDLTAQITTDEEVRARFNRDGICIPQNLIVVGTVNMDETTFSFSRKVLDRAMTIEMNEVNLNGGLTDKYEHIGKLGATELIGNAVEGVDIYSANKDVCDIAIAYLQSINDKLEGTPFKIAYRTRNEVLLYVVNNLPYKRDEEKEGFVIARALDEITNMKILSRIEGDETKVSQSFLDDLKSTIKEGLEKVFDGIFTEDNDGIYTSVSLSKLEEMKKRLESGYTSFWS